MVFISPEKVVKWGNVNNERNVHRIGLKQRFFNLLNLSLRSLVLFVPCRV